ncbi:MAG TPA: hypothetical protein DCZ95_05380 [Verrucomicrobia bacterium]|nr:MAG: hypothetical protein A2X46_10325 [Lentisphaerae bacterium GWF2_57_35]HBA83510.1 hypothetical protein [Verrucomicrobiota bacterium]
MATTIDDRYELVADGRTGLVSDDFAAFDRHANRSVLVRLIRDQAEERSAEALYRFRKLMDGLRSAQGEHIERVLAHGTWKGRDYVVLECPGEGALELSLGDQADLLSADRVAALIRGAARTLDHAHRHGLIHQSLSPESFLVRWDGEEPWVYIRNFGQYLLLDLAHIVDARQVHRVFGYLAPEQAGSLRKPIDERSDLYSLGIVFYQLLTGLPPYTAEDANALIYQHIATEPFPPSRVRREVPEILDRMCAKLMAKEPSERYQSADGLHYDLDEFLRLRRSGAPVVSFALARKDRLRRLDFSTRMVGRAQEQAQLLALLEEARNGRGAVCFLAGEPGVGKSRLVDELRKTVLKSDGLFLGGKCPTDRLTAPYYVFTQALDPLAGKIRMCDVEDQKRFAARVQRAVGDLGQEVLKISRQAESLLGHPPALDELEPEKAKMRFLLTAGEFIMSLGTPGAPLVLFLDDLQWADDASLELLERLGEKAARHAVLILASYRTEEGAATERVIESICRLKSAASIAEIALGPLTSHDVHELVAEVLLNDERSFAHLAEWLHARTRGNPFYALEMIRLLVDQGVIEFQDNALVCDPHRLAQSDLPDNAIDIVLRRIHALEDWERAILVYAAVIGRAVDVRVLAAVSGTPPEAVSLAVDHSIQRQILVRELVGSERVQFIHDRVREAFLDQAGVHQRRSLHLKIAQTLETHHAGQLDAVIYDLAYHYTQAEGDLEKVVLYNCRAGNAALKALGYRQAANAFEAARAVLEARGETQSLRYLDVLEDLGAACRLSAQLDEAITVMEAGEKLAETLAPERRNGFTAARAHALVEKGLSDEGAAVLIRSLRQEGFHIYRTRIGFVLSLIAELAQQGLHILFPSVFRNLRPCTDPRKLALLRQLCSLAHVTYYQDNVLTSFLFFLKTINYGDRIGLSLEHAAMYSKGTAIWATLPNLALANYSHRQSRYEARLLGDRRLDAVLRAHYLFIADAFNKADDGLAQLGDAEKTLLECGEYYNVSLMRTTSCRLVAQSGDIRKGLAIAESLLQLGRDAHMQQVEDWGAWNVGYFQSLLGEVTEQTIANLELAHRLAKESSDIPNISSSMSILGYAHLRRGAPQKAIECVEKAVALAKRPNAAFWILRTYPIGAEIYLEALRDPACSPERRTEYLKRAGWFCRMALKWGRRFPYALGWAWQVNGTWHWLNGRTRKAHACWFKGLDYLEGQTKDLHRIACIKYRSAELMLERDPRDRQAIDNLLSARDLFARCDDRVDGAAVARLIERYMPQLDDMEPRKVLTQKRHLESLMFVTQAIGSVFDLQELLDRVMEYARRVTGAERGLLMLRDAASGELMLQITAEGAQHEQARQAFGYESSRVSLSLTQEVQRRKEALIASSEDDSPAGKELKFMSVKQAMCVPLTTKEKDLGFLYLDNRLAGSVFGEGELELMKSFGIQASVSIENARLVHDLMEQDRMKQELQLGREIQRQLLPQAAPVIEGLKVCGLMDPAQEIGGDYYDFIVRTVDGRPCLGIAIGDVSGKGLGAGLAMAMLKTTMLTLSREAIDLPEILIKANRTMTENLNGMSFISLVYLQWNPASRVMSYCGAGHEHLLIYRCRSGEVEAIPAGGLVLGIMSDWPHLPKENFVALEPGDKIVLYTDGVTEAFNESRDEFGFERLLEAVRRYGGQSPADLISSLRAEVARFAHGAEQNDDITLVVMEAVSQIGASQG